MKRLKKITSLNYTEKFEADKGHGQKKWVKSSCIEHLLSLAVTKYI